MTRIKDGLVVASLATGIASIVVGRILGKKVREREQSVRRPGWPGGREHRAPAQVVGTLGKINLIATAASAR